MLVTTVLLPLSALLISSLFPNYLPKNNPNEAYGLIDIIQYFLFIIVVGFTGTSGITGIILLITNRKNDLKTGFIFLVTAFSSVTFYLYRIGYLKMLLDQI
jgi:hypothetical protein